jgi:hypothetical protein
LYFTPVTRQFVLDAIIEVLNGRWHGYGGPVRHYIEHRGNHYPAKAVLAIGRRLATGERSQFHSSVKLAPTFRHLGFRMVNSDREPINLPPALAV